MERVEKMSVLENGATHMRYRKGRSLQRSSNNDPHHCKPHRPPSTQVVTYEEIEDASREAAQIVNGHDDPSQRIVRLAHDLEKRLVGYDTGKDALIVAEEHEGELASEHDRYAQGSATAENGELSLHLESVRTQE